MTHHSVKNSLKHLIFDLDDTLLDTTQLLIPYRDSPLFLKKIQEPLPLMEGALDNLKSLQKKYTLHLLTQGRPPLQEKKIQSLSISSFFKTITIVNPFLEETKKDFFQKFCSLHYCQPQEVMSIGNRKSTDLGPAKECGFTTCWFAYGEHLNEPITQECEKPDFIIYHHFEMIKECQL
jgi:FMN phosphatase YigB (HAD superfamily)